MHHSKGEASLCARGVCVAGVQEVPADALGDARRGGLHRVPCQMSVAGGGLYLGVPEKLPDHGQALAEGQCARRKALGKRFLKEYVSTHCKPSTAEEYRRSVKLFIDPQIGRHLASDPVKSAANRIASRIAEVSG